MLKMIKYCCPGMEKMEKMLDAIWNLLEHCFTRKLIQYILIYLIKQNLKKHHWHFPYELQRNLSSIVLFLEKMKILEKSEGWSKIQCSLTDFRGVKESLWCPLNPRKDKSYKTTYLQLYEGKQLQNNTL